MAKYHIGLDLGGTKLLGIVTDGAYQIRQRRKKLLPRIATIDDLIKVIVEFYHQLAADLPPEELISVGLALPSPVNPRRGLAKSLTAFGWKDVPIGMLLQEKLNHPVSLGNDVNLATLAEFRLGAGRDMSSLFTFYPGTGLGGGYIQNGELVYGYNYTAAEVGHMVVQIDGPVCGCGQRGCLEAIVSNYGFRRMFREALARGETSMLTSNNGFSSDQLVAAWNKGDAVVRDILSFQARALGIGIANVINITGVECIIIGGGLYHALQKDLLPIVIQQAAAHSLGDGLEGVEIRLNELSEEAPALGAILLAG
ncbi:MAG: ROK family protein [FCB group bacterium]|nr:ROK family protein [FCB group bacterium]